MKNLKDIISEYSVDVDFTLFNRVYTVSAQRNVYHNLKLKYDSLANDIYKKFSSFIPKFTSLDDLINSAPEAFLVSLESGIKEISSDAVSVGYYSLDSESILSLCNKHGYFDDFKSAYQNYIIKNDAILSKLSNATTYREIRKESRGRWTSVTIGGDMAAAWGNQFRASTMNAIEGAGHSIRNAIGNAIDEEKAKEERIALFKNKELRNALANSVHLCASNLILIITDDLNKALRLNLGGWVTNSDKNNAESMFNNLTKLNLTLEQQKEFSYNILKLDPYNYKHYKIILTYFLENGKEILDIANFFNIKRLNKDIQEILADYARITAGKTPNDINNCRKRVYDNAAALGIPNNYLDKALNTIDDCGGKLLVNEVYNRIGTTEESAYECREYIDKLKKEMQLSDNAAFKAYNMIDQQLQKLDLEYRTVNGVVLGTREDADKAKKDLITYKEILETPIDFKFKSQFIDHINKIDQLPIDKSISQFYIARVNFKMAEFDKKCKIAARQEYRLQHGGMPFWNGDKKSMGIQYAVFAFLLFCWIGTFSEGIGTALVASLTMVIAPIVIIYFIIPKKEKKVWNELTENGRYSFNQIASADSSTRSFPAFPGADNNINCSSNSFTNANNPFNNPNNPFNNPNNPFDPKQP